MATKKTNKQRKSTKSTKTSKKPILKADSKNNRKKSSSKPMDRKPVSVKEFKPDWSAMKGDITKIVTSFEAACKILHLNPKHLPDVSMIPKRHGMALIADYKLGIIIDCLNQGWVADFGNWSQPKYFPVHYKKEGSSASGFDFSYTYCGYSDTYPGVGSRLCLKTRELSDYVGKKFIKLYEIAKIS